MENPAVGTYDVAMSYYKCHNKKSTAQPRTKQAYLRNASFTTAAKRTIQLSNADAETPGPGSFLCIYFVLNISYESGIFFHFGSFSTFSKLL